MISRAEFRLCTNVEISVSLALKLQQCTFLERRGLFQSRRSGNSQDFGAAERSVDKVLLPYSPIACNCYCDFPIRLCEGRLWPACCDCAAGKRAKGLIRLPSRHLIGSTDRFSVVYIRQKIPGKIYFSLYATYLFSLEPEP